ncbi:MAG TPA: class I SAM-dependent methyltransferase [Nitrospira sp.]|nr:class I SAM-dependent methyltransferase [Nitrospira sp.]
MKLLQKLIKSLRERKLTQDEWFKAVSRSYLKPPVTVDGKPLPKFPSDQIQINTTGQAGVATLREAFIFYQDCVENFKVLGSAIEPHHQLLDYGIGWGRIARFFLKELPLENIHGLDVMEDFVAICRETFGSNNFHVTTPFPPTTIPDGKFNFIVGYSVFSHLSEEACFRWMGEFHRVLAPGGMIALTTRGRPFFDFCESLRDKGHSGYLRALSTMFDDFGDARARYDREEFVHSNKQGVNGGGAMTAEFYGETFIPEGYARTAYAKQFILQKFLFNPTRQTHPIMFFRKKEISKEQK